MANKIVIRGPVVNEWTKAFQDIAKSLDVLKTVVAQTQAQAVKIDAAFSNLQGFTQFIDLAKDASQIQSSNFLEIAKGVNELAKALKTVTSIDTGKLVDLPNKIAQIANAIKNVPSTEKLKSFFDSFRDLTNLKPVNIDAQAAVPITQLSKITNGLEKLATVKTGDIGKAVKTFATASSLFKIVAKAVSIIPGGNELEKLSKSFSRIGDALDAFRRLANFQIDKANLINLGKSIVTFILSIRGISKFSGDPEKIKALAVLIKEVRGIFAIIPGTKEISLNDVKDFKSKLDLIVNSIKSLGKVNGSGIIHLPDIAGAIKRAFGGTEIQQVGQQVQDGFLDNVFRGFSERIGQGLYESISQGIKDIISGQGLQRLGDQLAQAGQSLIQNFGVQNLVQSKGFGLALGFDDISKQIGVFAKGLPIKEAQDFANVIGIQYPLSANEALQAILDLSKAGQNLPSIKNILPSAADISALSDSKDLQAATKFLIAAESGFSTFAKGIAGNFDNINIAANILFRAANVSTASIDSLQQGLAKAAPAANRFNVSLQDTAAYMTLFEDAGIRGAEAGNLFSTVLGSLSKDQARKELERLGVAWQNQDGTLRSVSTILNDVQKKYQDLNLTQVEVSQSLAKLGGDKFGQQGLSIIFGRGGINDVVSAMGDITDKANSANQAAQSLLESLKGQITQLQGSWDTLLTQIFLPMLDRFFIPVVKAARAFVDFLLQAPPILRQFASNFLILASAAASFIGAIAVGAGTVLKFAGIIQAIGFQLVRMVLLLPALIFQVAAFSVAILQAIVVIGIFSAAAIALNTLFTGIITAIENNVGGLGDKAQEISDTLNGIFSEFNRIAKTVSQAFALLFDRTFNRDAGDAIGFIGSLLKTFQDILKSVQKTLASISLEDIAFAVYFFGRQLNYTLGALGKFGEGILKIFRGDFSGGIESIVDGFKRLRNLVLSTVNVLFGTDLTKQVTRFFAQFSTTKVVEFLTNLKSSALGAFKAIQEGISLLTIHLVQFGQGLGRVWELIQAFFSGSIQLNDLFKGLGTELSTFVGTITNIVLSIGKAIVNGISSLLFDIIPNVSSFIANILVTIAHELRKIPLLIAQIGQSIGSDVLNQLGLALYKGDWGTVASTIVSLLFNALTRAIQELGSLASFLIQKLFPPHQTQTAVAQQFDFTFLIDIVSKVFSTIAATVSSVVNGVVSTVKNTLVSLGFLIVQLGVNIGSDFLKSLGFALRRGDILKSLLIIVDGFLAGIQLLLRRIPVFVQIIGRRLNSEIITTIGSALADSHQWKRVAGLVISGLQSAFSSLTTLIANIGSFVLNSIFGTKQVNETGDNIGNSIVNRIYRIIKTVFSKEALTRLFAAAVSIFAALVSEVLNLPGRLLQETALKVENSGLRTVIYALGTAFRTLSEPVSYVAGVFFRFAGILGDIAVNLASVILHGSNLERAFIAIAGVIAYLVSQGIGLRQVLVFIVENISILPSVIAQGIVAFKAFALQAAKVAYQAGLIIVAIIAVQQVLENFKYFSSGRWTEGIIRAFLGIGQSILSLVGVSDEAIAKTDSIIGQIVYIIQFYIRKLGNTLNRMVNQLGILIQKNIVEPIQGKSTTAVAEAQVNANIGTGVVGLTAIGQEFNKAVANGQKEQVDALTRVLYANNDKILEQFKQAANSGALTTIDANAFNDVIKVLTASGNLQEAFLTASKNGDLLLRTMQSLADTDVNAAAASFNDFQSALEQANLSDQQLGQAVQILDQLLTEGVISQSRYDEVISKIAGDMQAGTAIINQQGETIATVTKDWESADQAIANVSDKLGKNVNDLADWVSSAQDAEEQSKRLSDLYQQLFDLVDFGVIGREDANKYFDAVLQQTGLRRQSERDKLNPFQNTDLTANVDLNVNAPKLNDSGYKAFSKELQKQMTDSVTPQLDVNAPTQQQLQQQTAPTGEPAGFIGPSPEELQKQQDKIDKANQDYLDKQKDVYKNISKAQKSGQDDLIKIDKDGQLKRERDAEDHQNRLSEIAKSGAKAVIDAVASRDSAAAQSAVSQATTQSQQENDKYKLDQKRAAEDLQRQKDESAKRTAERIADYQDQLKELQLKHIQDIAEIQKQNAEELAQNQAAAAEQLAQDQMANAAIAEENQKANDESIKAAKAKADEELSVATEHKDDLVKLGTQRAEDEFNATVNANQKQVDLAQEQTTALTTETQTRNQTLLDQEKRLTTDATTEAGQRTQQMGDQMHMLWDTLYQAISSAMPNITAAINSFVANMQTAQQSLLSNSNTMLNSVGSAMNNRINQLQTSVNTGKSLFGGLGNAITNAVTTFNSNLYKKNSPSASFQSNSFTPTQGSAFGTNAGSQNFAPQQVTVQRNLTNLTNALGSIFKGFRAAGGDVKRNFAYRVGENQNELLQQGNKLYLIPSANGQIIPPSVNRAGAALSNANFDFHVDLGGIVISGDNLDSAKILQDIEAKVVPKLSERIQHAAQILKGQV